MSDEDLKDAKGEQERAAQDAMHAAEVGGAHASPDNRRGGPRRDGDDEDDEAVDRTSQTEDTGSQPTGS